MNIIDCLKDKNLLGQFISDPSTWQAWFTFLKVFFALPPEKGDFELFQKCTGRDEWPTSAAIEAWLIIGTRGGKSRVTALVAAFLATFKKYELASGEKGYIIIVSPTRYQSGIIKRYLSSFFNENPFLRPFLVREWSEEIELNNQVVIAVLSSDYRSLRGFTAVCGIVDEIAYLGIEGAKPDVEVVRALRTRLTSTGGPLICISSPYAKRGQLYETHKKHFGVSSSPILVWQADSLTMNPTLKVSKIEQAYAEDPEGASADYGAQFRSDIETFITRETVEASVVPGRYEQAPVPGIQYMAFNDAAGGSGADSMTLGISHVEGDKRILDLIREVKPPFSPDSVVREFANLLKRYRCHAVTGDRYAGEWPRERFRMHGIRYEVSPLAKSDIYLNFLPLINSGQVELLDNQVLVNQLCNLERRTGRGKDSIDHPPNQHDDVINAAAGALVDERRGITPRIAVVTQGPIHEELPEPPTLKEGEYAIPIWEGDKIVAYEKIYRNPRRRRTYLPGIR